MRTEEALRYAQERDLDLVEVAPEARPPVTRILDYSKYKYEQAQKQKAARKHQQQITIREIKFRPKIAQNDYDTKKGHVMRFLKRKDKVKITIMFRGREVTHPERGQQLLERLAEELKDLAIVEQRPNLDGRNMTMMLGPSKAILSGTYDPEATDDAAADEPDGAGGEAAEAASGEAAEAASGEAASEPAASEPAAPAASEPAATAPAASQAAEPAAGEPNGAGDEAAEPAASEAAGNGAGTDDAATTPEAAPAAGKRSRGADAPA